MLVDLAIPSKSKQNDAHLKYNCKQGPSEAFWFGLNLNVRFEVTKQY